MLKPTSLVRVRINAAVDQQRVYDNNADGGLITALNIIANLSKAETTTETVKAAAATAQSTFYNKFTNKDVIYDESNAPEGTDPSKILDDETFYIEVAKGMPTDMEYVEIAGVKKTADEIVKVSIGMNAWIHAPLWKVDESNVLKVAIPYLCAAADPATGMAEVYASGITYKVPAMDPIEEGKGLVIKEAWIQEKEGCEGAISVKGQDISLVIGHQAQAAGVIFECGGKSIPTGTPIYIINPTSMSMTAIENMAGKNDTYAWYTVPWVDAPITASQDGTLKDIQKHVVIPGYGAIKLNIKAVLKAPIGA